MPRVYSERDIQNLSEGMAPGVENAALLTRMQIDPALEIAREKELSTDDQTVLAIAQVITTNWSGLD